MRHFYFEYIFMHLKIALPFLFLSFFIFFSCGSTNENKDNDRLLAKASNKSLYLSELDGMIPEGTTPEDSSLIINAYIQRWIKETLLLREAERRLPNDLNIDQLVRDYRASLIRDNYEKVLVEEFLDSTVTQAELTEFYEKNKEQYQLDVPIVRCRFVKVPLPVPEESTLRELWNSSDSTDYEKLITYCNTYAEAHSLEDSTWQRIDNLALAFPKGTITVENISGKKDFTQKDDNYQFYFRLLEIRNKKEIAPLSYIENQARKVILHRRKIELLEDKKGQLYDIELRKNNVEIFYQ